MRFVASRWSIYYYRVNDPRIRGLDKKHQSAQYVGMRHVSPQETSEGKPLTEPVLLILTSLAAHPRHGYALIKDIELLSGGRVRMSTGTLFGALRRLLEDGWIERFEQEDTARQKQAYRLTATGIQQLQIELERMRQLTRAGFARLRASEAI